MFLLNMDIMRNSWKKVTHNTQNIGQQRVIYYLRLE